jgi:DUF4097 and DUF4098 domain-containing protein YvlB
MRLGCALVFLMIANVAHAQQRLAGAPLQANARVTIVAPSAGVRITGWDRNEVAVYGSSAASGAVSVTGTAQHAELALRGVVSVEIMLPRGAQVRVDGGGGDVVIRKLSGTIEAETSGGGLDIEGTTRSINAYSMGGHVEIAGGGTEITRVETVGGAISITNANGLLDVKSGSGDIIVRGSVGDAQLFNVSGLTRFEGTVESGGRLSVESVSGIIKIVVPRSLSAEYDLASISARVHNAFGPAIRRRNDGSSDEIRFTVGDGAARIRGFNVSGPVSLIAR